MRAFIALQPPEAFLDDVEDLARELACCCDGRFVPRQNYHVTLAFLGEIDEEGARSAMASIDAACAGAGPAALIPTGLGTFGSRRNKTLWLGLQNVPELGLIADCMRDELDQRGLDYDRKGFLPHITLARRAVLPDGALPALAFPREAEAQRVVLYRSYLEEEGPRYKELYAAELAH